MKAKKLMMPLALIFSVFMFSNANAAKLDATITKTGIPFTVAYLKAHHFAMRTPKSEMAYMTGRLQMLFTRTQAGLFDDWNITISNGNFSYTWRTTDSSTGYINRSYWDYYEFTAYYDSTYSIPEGTYDVTVQCNQWQAYRDDIVIGGDNNTGGSVWDYNAYDNAYVVHGVEVVDGGAGVSIGTSTNY